MPDGTLPSPVAGTGSRSRSATSQRTVGTAARGRCQVPQRHRHRRRRQADPGRRPVRQPGRAVRADRARGKAAATGFLRFPAAVSIWAARVRSEGREPARAGPHGKGPSHEAVPASVHHAGGAARAVRGRDPAVFKDVDAVNAEIQAAGAWVFAGGLHPPETATVVRIARRRGDHHRRPVRRDQGAARRLLGDQGRRPRRRAGLAAKAPRACRLRSRSARSRT